MTNTFLRWAGSKKWLARMIDDVLPQGFEGIDTFVEPFAGGASMSFAISSKKNIEHIILNDMNDELITAFLMLKSSPDKVVSELSKMADEYVKLDDAKQKDYYYSVRSSFNSCEFEDHAMRAAQFIFLNKTCWNGLWRVNSDGVFNTPAGFMPRVICDKEGLMECSKALEKASFSNGCYEDMLEYAGPKTMYYLDPPYMPLKGDGFTAYTKSGFTADDHANLKRFCDEAAARGSKVLVSNSGTLDADGEYYFAKLYAGWHVKEMNASRRINSDTGGRQPVKELLISNYELKI